MAQFNKALRVAWIIKLFSLLIFMAIEISWYWSQNKILVFLSLLASTSLYAATYKWTDEKGNVVYSQQPPKSGPYELIKGLKHSGPKPAFTGNKDSSGTNSSPSTLEEVAQQEDEKKHNCEAAKKNLTLFKTYNRIKNEDGSITTLTGEEKQKQIKEAEDQIRLFCN